MKYKDLLEELKKLPAELLEKDVVVRYYKESRYEGHFQVRDVYKLDTSFDYYDEPFLQA